MYWQVADDVSSGLPGLDANWLGGRGDLIEPHRPFQIQNQTSPNPRTTSQICNSSLYFGTSSQKGSTSTIYS